MKSFDHVLIIGFGGPTQREEILPFLEHVARGRNIPEERLKEVSHHYEAVGGLSPYNAYTFQLAEKLKAALQADGFALPVFVGMRNWHPFLDEPLSDIKVRGLKKGVGIILAPHRSETSYERYIQNVNDARQAVGAAEVQYEYLKPWHDHPLFIQAQADEVRKILSPLSSPARKETHLLFSAHSIPLDMPGCARYQEGFRQSSALVASELGVDRWSIAYQSRSGNPSQLPRAGAGRGDQAAIGRLARPWCEPDVVSVIRQLASKGEKRVALVPVGFLCDNVEVLYDLDIEAREEAEKAGLQYLRARTVTDHPKFVSMLKTLILEASSVPHSA